VIDSIVYTSRQEFNNIDIHTFLVTSTVVALHAGSINTIQRTQNVPKRAHGLEPDVSPKAGLVLPRPLSFLACTCKGPCPSSLQFSLIYVDRFLFPGPLRGTGEKKRRTGDRALIANSCVGILPAAHVAIHSLLCHFGKFFFFLFWGS